MEFTRKSTKSGLPRWRDFPGGRDRLVPLNEWSIRRFADESESLRERAFARTLLNRVISKYAHRRG